MKQLAGAVCLITAPLVGSFLAWMILGEQISETCFLSGFLIAAGISLSLLPLDKRARISQP